MVDLVPTITLTNLEMTQKLKNLVSDVRTRSQLDLDPAIINIKKLIVL
jgi:hypothetical protein